MKRPFLKSMTLAMLAAGFCFGQGAWACGFEYDRTKSNCAPPSTWDDTTCRCVPSSQSSATTTTKFPCTTSQEWDTSHRDACLGTMSTAHQTYNGGYYEMNRVCVSRWSQSYCDLSSSSNSNNSATSSGGGGTITIKQSDGTTIQIGANGQTGDSQRGYISQADIDKYQLSPAQVESANAQIKSDSQSLNSLDNDRENIMKYGSADGIDGKGAFKKQYSDTDSVNTNMTVQERVQADTLANRHDLESLNEAKQDLKGAPNDKENQDALKTAQADYDKSSAHLKQDKADAKAANEAFEKDGAQKYIEIQHVGNYGGFYGGTNPQTTQAINTGIGIIGQTTQTINTAVVQNANSNAQNRLVTQGSSATIAASYQTQATQAKNGAESLAIQAGITTGLATLQMARGAQHLLSKSDVSKSAQVGTTDANALYAKSKENDVACTKGDPQACKDAATFKKEAQMMQDNVDKNEAGEKSAQDAAATAEMMAGTNTALQAMGLELQRVQALNQAQMYTNAAQASNGGFVYNPNTMNPNMGDNPNNAAAPVPNQVLPSADNLGPAPNNSPFNPNMDNGNVGGPAPGAFTRTDPSGKSMSAVGGGLGSTGGTSPAKPDGSGADPNAPGKTQVGGSYASGDGAGSGSKYTSKPGGQSDSSLFDFMKKFLPGAPEDGSKNAGKETYRDLASESPSVLGRNTNLFEEVSKSYKKKSIEGAVIFKDGV